VLLEEAGKSEVKLQGPSFGGVDSSLTFETSHSFKYIKLPYHKSSVCLFIHYKPSDPVACFQRGLVPACRMAKVRTRRFSRPPFVRKLPNECIRTAPPSFNCIFIFCNMFNIHYHCFKVHISRIASQRIRIKVRPGLQQSNPAPPKREPTQ
jgi:hypothetical protein